MYHLAVREKSWVVVPNDLAWRKDSKGQKTTYESLASTMTTMFTSNDYRHPTMITTKKKIGKETFFFGFKLARGDVSLKTQDR